MSVIKDNPECGNRVPKAASAPQGPKATGGEAEPLLPPLASADPAPDIARHSAEETSGIPRRRLGLIFAALMTAMLMASLSQTVLSTALPTVVGDLDGVEHMAWVITGYIMASTAMMPAYGKLGDMFGRKPLFLVAIVVFIIGALAAGAAQNMGWLIAARAVQGLGGGGVIVLSQATIADVVPARERGRYMGALGAVFAFSSVVGPLLGGWLTVGPGWRWTLWMNVPVGVLALLGIAFLLKVPHRKRAHGHVDYMGMALLVGALTSLVLTLAWGGDQYPWGSPVILSLGGAFIVLTALFMWTESRAAEPIIPLFLFRNRNFRLTVIAGLIVGAAMFAALGYMPTYLQMVSGYSPAEAGLLMIPMMGTMMLTSIIMGRRVAATGRYKNTLIVGSLLAAAGLGLVSSVDADSSLVLVCSFLSVLGFGIGSVLQLLTLVAQESFSAAHIGTATAGQNYFRQVGATLGTAVIGSMFAARLTSGLEGRIPNGAMGPEGVNSLTPAVVNDMPDRLYAIVVEAYNDALIPLFLWMVPVVLMATVALILIEEKPLSTTLER